MCRICASNADHAHIMNGEHMCRARRGGNFKREKQFFCRRTENSCPHLCFNGASTFAVPGAVANVRNKNGNLKNYTNLKELNRNCAHIDP